MDIDVSEHYTIIGVRNNCLINFQFTFDNKINSTRFLYSKCRG